MASAGKKKRGTNVKVASDPSELDNNDNTKSWSELQKTLETRVNDSNEKALKNVTQKDLLRIYESAPGVRREDVAILARELAANEYKSMTDQYKLMLKAISRISLSWYRDSTGANEHNLVMEDIVLAHDVRGFNKNLARIYLFRYKPLNLLLGYDPGNNDNFFLLPKDSSGFDRVDGKRSIKQVLPAVSPSKAVNDGFGRAFVESDGFRRLFWLYYATDDILLDLLNVLQRAKRENDVAMIERELQCRFILNERSSFTWNSFASKPIGLRSGSLNLIESLEAIDGKLHGRSTPFATAKPLGEVIVSRLVSILKRLKIFEPTIDETESLLNLIGQICKEQAHDTQKAVLSLLTADQISPELILTCPCAKPRRNVSTNISSQAFESYTLVRFDLQMILKKWRAIPNNVSFTKNSRMPFRTNPEPSRDGDSYPDQATNRSLGAIEPFPLDRPSSPFSLEEQLALDNTFSNDDDGEVPPLPPCSPPPLDIMSPQESYFADLKIEYEEKFRKANNEKIRLSTEQTFLMKQGKSEEEILELIGNDIGRWRDDVDDLYKMESLLSEAGIATRTFDDTVPSTDEEGIVEHAEMMRASCGNDDGKMEGVIQVDKTVRDLVENVMALDEVPYADRRIFAEMITSHFGNVVRNYALHVSESQKAEEAGDMKEFTAQMTQVAKLEANLHEFDDLKNTPRDELKAVVVRLAQEYGHHELDAISDPRHGMSHSASRCPVMASRPLRQVDKNATAEDAATIEPDEENSLDGKFNYKPQSSRDLTGVSADPDESQDQAAEYVTRKEENTECEASNVEPEPYFDASDARMGFTTQTTANRKAKVHHVQDSQSRNYDIYLDEADDDEELACLTARSSVHTVGAMRCPIPPQSYPQNASKVTTVSDDDREKILAKAKANADKRAERRDWV